MKLFLNGLLACMWLSVAWAGEPVPRQAYVLAGDIMGGGALHPAILYRVENGGLTKMRTIVTKQQNAEMIRAYQDKGFVLVLSRMMPYDSGSVILDVIDLSSVATELVYEIDTCEGCSYGDGHFANKNGRPIFIVEAFDDSFEQFYYGVDVATGAMVDGLGLSDFKSLHLIGSAYRSGGDGLAPLGLEDRRPVASTGNPRSDVYFDFVLPEALEGKECCVAMTIHNDFMVVFVLTWRRHEPPKELSSYVLDRTSGEWIELKSNPASRERAFREWLVTSGTRFANPDDNDYERLSDKRVEPFLSTRYRFRDMEQVPTGRLRFYNVRTRKEINHDTGVLYSEVLLIDEDDVAYIRMADQLWRARIADDGLEDMELMAQSEALLNVHWMVLGYE